MTIGVLENEDWFSLSFSRNRIANLISVQIKTGFFKILRTLAREMLPAVLVKQVPQLKMSQVQTAKELALRHS